MRVAFFAESLPPNEDGVSKTLLKLSEFLDRKRVQYKFVSPFKPGENHYLNEKVKRLKYVPFPAYSQYRLSIPFFNGIRNYLDDFKPDVLHLTSPTLLGIYSIWYSKLRNVPLISTYHTHFVSYMKYYGLKKLEDTGWKYIKWFYNQCNVTHVPTNSIKEELEEHGIKNIEHIPHGIETEVFTPEKENKNLRENFDNEYPIILYVGRLVKEKDLIDIIKVNKRLQERNCKFNMVFIGNGPMKGELRENLPEAYFTGHLSGQELQEWFASADIFAYPSTTETFGLVVQEAFSSGLPVVGVAKGGVGSLIQENQTGLHFSPHNIKEFADGLQKLLKNKGLREKMGKSARKYAEENDWDKVNQKVLDSYKRIISKA